MPPAIDLSVPLSSSFLPSLYPLYPLSPLGAWRRRRRQFRLIRNGAPTSIPSPPRRTSGATAAADADAARSRCCLPESSSGCSIYPPSRGALENITNGYVEVKPNQGCQCTSAVIEGLSCVIGLYGWQGLSAMLLKGSNVHKCLEDPVACTACPAPLRKLLGDLKNMYPSTIFG